jgi:hypothetical protein
MDNSGLTSRAGVVVNIVPLTMQRSVLFIDDWQEGATSFKWNRGILPSDQEHDAFWADMLSDVADFVPIQDMLHLEPGKGSVPLERIGNYRTIIWDAIGSYNGKPGSELTNYIKFIPSDPSLLEESAELRPNIVQLFMAAGGRVLLCGQNVMTGAINRELDLPGTNLSYPFIFRYELTWDQDGTYQDSRIGIRGVGDDSFAYDDCCLNALDIAYVSNPQLIRRPPLKGCPAHGHRDFNSGKTDGLRACVPVDETYAFPKLELRPEVSDPGKWYHESALGLNCDIYNPPYFSALCEIAELSPRRECFQPIYSLECLNVSSNVFGAPIAFWTSTAADRVPAVGGDPARSAIWGFEPVYFNPTQVKQALDIVLFDEWKLPPKQMKNRTTR